MVKRGNDLLDIYYESIKLAANGHSVGIKSQLNPVLEVSQVEYANLSLDEIKRQLEEAESKQAELNRLLAVRRHEGRDEVIRQIREIIESNGYEYDEIVPYLTPKRGRGRRPSLFTQPKPSSFSARQYTRYVDPDNADNIYVRGVLPAWMKQKMQEQGYDPSSKTDRETFKANSLRVLEG